MRIKMSQLRRIIREAVEGRVEIYNSSPDDGWNTYVSFDEAFLRCVDPSVNEYVMCSKDKGFTVENEGMPFYYQDPYAEEMSGLCIFVGCATKEECEDEFKGSALEI